jgi:EAL domain-containing protein (putative c-di-GMP-specific phosphodiesterase class I)
MTQPALPTSASAPLKSRMDSPPSIGRVLLAEDDPGVRRDYARMLQFLGFSVQGATDGAEALGLLQDTPYDLIISDIEMPGMGGVEFLRAVRKQNVDIPVILITGNPTVDSAVAAVQHGAISYLSKPVAFSEFGEAVRHATNLYHLAKLKREALEIVKSQNNEAELRAQAEACFDAALTQLWIAYQPIVNSTECTVVAYEALVRSNEPTLGNPMALLETAEELGRVHDLGRRIRQLVAANAINAPEGTLLFVNLHSLDLNDPELYDANAPLSAIASRVVLEITERVSLAGVDDLSRKVACLRELGYRIAVDDLGAGYAALSCFTQLDPEFVKLDMSLVRNVDKSPRKQSVIRALMQLCARDLAIQVVTEGVETAAERDVLRELGCELLQGYLYARPGKDFPTPSWKP